MILKSIVLLTCLLGLPVFGVLIAGKPLKFYCEFPPTTRYIQHEQFSWPIFVLLSLFVTVLLSPFFLTFVKKNRISQTPNQTATKNPFPLWGWLGLVACGCFWILAWNRFPWFAKFQQHTFTPIWISYILVMNAWIYHRKGFSLFTRNPGFYVSLFFISAIFWWYFEFLNRFVQNWHYQGVDSFNRGEYFLFATLCFSTVLPAVLSTKELLECYPIFRNKFQNWIPIHPNKGKKVPLTIFFLSCASLITVGIFPNHLFPILWVSPLLIICSFQAYLEEPHIFNEIKRGNWVEICTWSLAALCCGFFWELWNYFSFAKWRYTIPYVQRFHLFEMPVLGYFGYIPFGLECAVIVRFVCPDWVRKKFHQDKDSF